MTAREKPIIRHCYNCKWYRSNIPIFFGGDYHYECNVKYIKHIYCPRCRAIICKYYTKEEI